MSDDVDSDTVVKMLLAEEFGTGFKKVLDILSTASNLPDARQMFVEYCMETITHKVALWKAGPGKDEYISYDEYKRRKGERGY